MSSKIENIREVTWKLYEYCRKENWKGYDPYDALNSRLFALTPLFRSKWARIAFTQFNKRSPINFRPIFGISKDYNPKGLALFVSALIKLEKAGFPVEEGLVEKLLYKIKELRSRDFPWFCWGYNFPWQNRTTLVPRYSPNIICTTFVGNAFLDGYRETGNQEYLDIAASAGEFLFEGLNRTEDGNSFCFSYTTLDHSQVHNANLLGAAYLARLNSFLKLSDYKEIVEQSIEYSVNRQRPDGSWYYGEATSQKWIDNFHTGFNLCALHRISRYLENDDLRSVVRIGFNFYQEHFFDLDGAPKYFHNAPYPIDIHSSAQALVTFVELQDIDQTSQELAWKVYTWTIQAMRSRRGYFFFQKNPWYINRIFYMRWSQAWMLMGLAGFIEAGMSRKGLIEKGESGSEGIPNSESEIFEPECTMCPKLTIPVFR